MYTEFLNNSMHNSDGITLLNNPTIHQPYPCNATPGFISNVSWIHWSIVRRNTISGISQAALSANRTHPQCGGVRVAGGMPGPKAIASTDVIVEHNSLECPSSGVAWGTEISPGCEHCVSSSQDDKGRFKSDDEAGLSSGCSTRS